MFTARILNLFLNFYSNSDPRLGNTSNHSEESSSSDTASASAAKLLQIAKMNAASVYILDVGAKEPLKERFLSAVAQASGGLYRSTTSNKVLELREVNV